MKQKWKRKFASIAAFIILLSYTHDHSYESHYEILDDDLAYASYRNGNIYIGDMDFLLQLKPTEGDILVLDQRSRIVDPNMKIYHSYEITDRDTRNEILEVLCSYEKEHPSDWDRSIESMRLEWFCHNVSYLFEYESFRSSAVDLNNADEKKFDSKILQKIFRL